jgi:hypothetical protein
MLRISAFVVKAAHSLVLGGLNQGWTPSGGSTGEPARDSKA